MDAPDENIPPKRFEISEHRKLLRPAIAAGFLALTLLWLCLSQPRNSFPDISIAVIPGPYCFELAFDDTLAAMKSTIMRQEDLLVLNVKMDSATVFVLEQSSLCGPIKIIVDDFPDRTFSGSLSFYDQIVATAKNKKEATTHAVIEIINPERLLKAGTRVRTAVLLDTSLQAAFLPDSAIFEMNGEAVVFARSDWPKPRAVQIGPASGANIMIAEGIEAGEDVALLPPENSRNVQRLSLGTYQKLLSESRQKAMQLFAERLDDGMYRALSDSFAIADKGAGANDENFQGGEAFADCTAVIDRMLLEDSSRGITKGRVRIGPGEGGKLAPVSPESLKEMRSGEKISVTVPAKSNTSAVVRQTENRPHESDSSKTNQEPPEER